jgi:hypothetical protein
VQSPSETEVLNLESDANAMHSDGMMHANNGTHSDGAESVMYAHVLAPIAASEQTPGVHGHDSGMYQVQISGSEDSGMHRAHFPGSDGPPIFSNAADGVAHSDDDLANLMYAIQDMRGALDAMVRDDADGGHIVHEHRDNIAHDGSRDVAARVGRAIVQHDSVYGGANPRRNGVHFSADSSPALGPYSPAYGPHHHAHIDLSLSTLNSSMATDASFDHAHGHVAHGHVANTALPSQASDSERSSTGNGHRRDPGGVSVSFNVTGASRDESGGSDSHPSRETTHSAGGNGAANETGETSNLSQKTAQTFQSMDRETARKMRLMKKQAQAAA